MRYILNFIAELLGGHVCSEFTQWENKSVIYTRLANEREHIIQQIREVRWQENYQERRCTLCGHIQQKKLKW